MTINAVIRVPQHGGPECLTLDEVAQAHRTLESRGTIGNVLLLPQRRK